MNEQPAEEIVERLAKIERRNKAFDDRIMIVTTILMVFAFVMIISDIRRD